MHYWRAHLRADFPAGVFFVTVRRYAGAVFAIVFCLSLRQSQLSRWCSNEMAK